MDIKRKISPYNFTALSGKQIKYIVIHYVGGVSTAKNNADYFYNNKLSSSAHYFVDENEIWQSVEDYNSAWHCGGGIQGSGGRAFYKICLNSNSIGIEMCCKKNANGWYFEDKTVENTVKLVKMLMKKYGVSPDNVIRHYDVTGKNCPAPYVDENEWQKFKKLISQTEAVMPEEIVAGLFKRGIVTDTSGMLEEIKRNPNGRLYWLARKCLSALTNG